MLYLVPWTGAGRQLVNGDVDVKFVGEALWFALPGRTRPNATAASLAEFFRRRPNVAGRNARTGSRADLGSRDAGSVQCADRRHRAAASWSSAAAPNEHTFQKGAISDSAP
jgi:hypothetical protein